MADITMCTTDGCPMQERCYRKTADVNPQWQSMGIWDWTYARDSVSDDCGRFECEGFLVPDHG